MIIVICSLMGKCLVLSILMFLITNGAAECPSGKFGASCELVCHCERRQCDRHGRCTNGAKCERGYSGLTCQRVLPPICEPEWFGTECQHQCLCTEFRCDRLGQCINGSHCKSGYFGPSCQYGDIIHLPSFTSDVPVWLRDEDDETCNSDPTFQNLSVKFYKGLPFYWLRLTVSRSSVLRRFNIKLNDVASCHNMRMVPFGDKTVDIYCDMGVDVKTLTLTGAGVSFLCSMSISLGRNVVPRKVTDHPSINLHGELKTTLEEDKHQRTGARKFPCPKEPVSSWMYRFTTPQSVSAFLLTGNKTSFGISLKTFNAKGQLVNSFRNVRPMSHLYVIRPQEITEVSVKAKMNESLRLCEMFMLGETSCPEGMYGLDCTSHCECSKPSEVCFISTGGCAAPCPIGFYGFNCSRPCPASCMFHMCAPRYGDCIEHVNPVRALNIALEQECPEGFYGKACKTPCPKVCKGKCNSLSGECEICSIGFYGTNCTHQCSQNCFQKKCHPETGYCLDCISGYYGSLCNYDCGAHCYLLECNSTTGKCFSCAPGYKGENCTLVPWNVTLFIVLLFLIPSVIACFFCCEVLSDDESEEVDKISTSTQMSMLYSSAI